MDIKKSIVPLVFPSYDRFVAYQEFRYDVFKIAAETYVNPNNKEALPVFAITVSVSTEPRVRAAYWFNADGYAQACRNLEDKREEYIKKLIQGNALEVAPSDMPAALTPPPVAPLPQDAAQTPQPQQLPDSARASPLKYIQGKLPGLLEYPDDDEEPEDNKPSDDSKPLTKPKRRFWQ